MKFLKLGEVGVVDVSKICSMLTLKVPQDIDNPDSKMISFVKIDLDCGTHVPVVCENVEATCQAFAKLIDFWINPKEGLTPIEDIIGFIPKGFQVFEGK